MTKPPKSKELRLEDILFNCRDLLRGKASVADKRDLMLTLVFLRFIGEKFTLRREEIREELLAKKYAGEFLEKQMDNPARYGAKGCFFLPEDCRWETIANHKADNKLNVDLDGILNRLEIDNDALKGALPQKIFTSAEISPNDLKKVIDEIGKVTHKNFPDRDLIGRVYEYYLQAFAIQAKDAKEQGEFYTPHSIVNLIASIIEPIDGTIYDPCCGSGGMFVQSVKIIEAHGGNKDAVSVYGQESDPETFRLAKMNLAVRGISHNLGPKNLSTFEQDFHRGTKMDYIIANPPFNLKKWKPSADAISNPLWGKYGTPPESNANNAWILHMLHKLNEKRGIAGFLLANGALDDEDTLGIRQKLVENDKVEAIVVLPREMFYSTDISVTMWVLNQNKKGGRWHGRQLRDRSGEILFIDLRTWNQNVYEKKYVRFTDEQIAAVVKIYQDWQTGGPQSSAAEYARPELYRAVKKDEIAANNWSLVPSRYIEFVDRDTELDYKEALKTAGAAASDLLKRQDENAKRLAAAFKALGVKQRRVSGTVLRSIGSLISLCDERNTNRKYGVDAVRGVNITKDFMPTAANIESVDLRKYKVVNCGRFVFSGMQTGRDGCIRIALSTGDEPFLVSPAYDTFEVSSDKLLPEYLHLLFLRPEMDRLGWFLSDSSVRANLDWNRFCEIKIPLPPIEVQQAIVDVYRCANEAKKIAEEADRLSREICPALVRWAADTGTNPSKPKSEGLTPITKRRIM